MKPTNISRRNFLKGSAGVVAGLSLTKLEAFAGQTPVYAAKGIPTRILGKTGVKVPLIGIGTGSRFCSIKKEDTRLEILTTALDNGMYYWDTAHEYQKGDVVSEEQLGKLLKQRRDEVFLATKVAARNPDKAKKEIEKSLKRLQTDHVDLYQIHNIKSIKDVDDLGKKGGLVDIVHGLREEGITKYIGFTGHTSAAAMKLMTERYDFDTMLIALNHFKGGKQNFEEDAITAAGKKGMGIIGMKVVRPRETVSSVTPQDLIRYALSLPYVTLANIGTDSLEVISANLTLAKNFKKMNDEEMEKIRVSLAPFYRHENLEWMHPGYLDGNWA